MIKLSVAEFKWKTTEQVYPFEKGATGETLFCKKFTFTNFTRTLNIPHGVGAETNIYRMFGDISNASGYGCPLPAVQYQSFEYAINFSHYNGNISIQSGADHSGGYSGNVYLIYKK